ncbi:hypothetical protein MASR2M74_01800 [Paracoccaceae bacterium]
MTTLGVDSPVCAFSTSPKEFWVMSLQSGFEGVPHVFPGHIAPVIAQARGQSRSPVVVKPLAIDFRGRRARAKEPIFFRRTLFSFRLARHLPDLPDLPDLPGRKTV